MNYDTVKPSVAITALWEIWERSPVRASHRAQSDLYRALFCDIASTFPNFVHHDYAYLLSRIEKEGESFYLATLPHLGKVFETSLITEQEFITPVGWPLMVGTRLPKFCYSLFTELYHDDGRLRYVFSNCRETIGYDIPRQKKAVAYLRQLFMMWSKVQRTSDVKDYDQLITQFIERVTLDRDIICDPKILNEARRLLRCLFTTATPELSELRAFKKRPWGRHGPGAVAGRESGAEKWLFNQWPGLPSNLFDWSPTLRVNAKEVEAQPSSRLCLVPKDFRGPRIICIEPKENQFAQQGLMDILYRLIERHSLSGRSISFRSVEKSTKSCYDYRKATIDLKDASDTVTVKLVKLLFPKWVFELVTRYRTRSIITPKGVITPRCFATMGSAVCFPVETLVFWALSLGTQIVIRDSFPLRLRKGLNLCARVFGDDIIVPVWACEAVQHALATCGLVINTQKTCCFSLVRESCGEWVYSDERCKIARFHSTCVTDPQSYIQWRDLLRDLGRENYPALYEEISDHLHTFCDERAMKEFRRRYNTRLQRMEIFAPVMTIRGARTELVDAAGLYAWHVGNDRVPFLKGARKRVKMRWQALADYLL